MRIVSQLTRHQQLYRANRTHTGHLLTAALATALVGFAARPAAAQNHAPALLAPDAVTHAASAGSFAAAVDGRGVPQLLIATDPQPMTPGATPETATWLHLTRHAVSLGASAAVLGSVELVSLNDLGRGGVIARLRQRVDGIEVYRGDLRMLMKPNLELAAISGQLQPVSAPRPDSHPFRISPEDALARALNHLYGSPNSTVAPALISAASRLGDGDARYTIAEGAPVFFPEPAHVKKVFFPEGAGSDRLLAAWFIEVYSGNANSTSSDAFRYLVAADDGRVLERRDLTAYDSFNYRVWADQNGDKRPYDGPQVRWAPHPTGKPGAGQPAFVTPNLIAMEGFNKNPMGAADPWLPPGATESNGNNVDGYVDRNAPDGFSAGDFRASTTSANTFDRTYDVTLGPVANNAQAMAGIIQLFYVTNWLHDDWYNAGFNEAAGNAQKNNFGRGGAGNDPLLAEAQDDVFGMGRNNSNMQTASDGMSPRMQVFVWDGLDARKLTITPPGGDIPTSGAGFGPSNFDVTGSIILVNDGKGTVTDACEPIVNNVTGKIALIDRGNCTFKQKVVNAQAAGAIGVLITDNKPGPTPPPLNDGPPMANVTIGAFGITMADGNTIKAALGNGNVTAHLVRNRGVDRDGTLDNTVVAHEWGHYLHHRLADCGSQQSQCSAISEGWGDFNALFMVLRDGDNLDGAYPLAVYSTVTFGDSYFGIRREPYSVDQTKDGLSFRHISNGQQLPNTPLNGAGVPNSEVHAAGEIWASMMWEAYVALQKDAKMRGLTFDDARRRMASYVVAGLQLTPSEATYTESRDAILAAAAVQSQSDAAVIAQAFARRGAGSCAVSPARDSMNFSGVVESSDVKARLTIGALTLDDSVKSCDNDGVLDAGETGHLTIAVMNGGPALMTGTTLSVKTMTTGITFPNGTTAMVPDVMPYATVKVTLDVALDLSVMKMGGFDAQIDVASNSSCEGTATRSVVWRVNYDEVPAATATDDVESEHPLWKTGNNLTVSGDKVWFRGETAPLSHAWRGIDYGAVSDTWLESPDLQVSANAPLSIAFDHRHSFEVGVDMGIMRNFDGAVLEVTSDGGMTWQDITAFAKSPYGGKITNVSGNPLADHDGFVGKNPGYPAQQKISLDLGMMLAGKTIRIRFRIGTDQAASEFGWEIDNIAFGGIDNKPFATLIDDPGHCRPVGGPDAGMMNPDLATNRPTDDGSIQIDTGMLMPGLASNGCTCSIAQRGPKHSARFAFLLALGGLVLFTGIRRRRV